MKKTYREKLLDVLRQLPDEVLHNVMDEEWDKSEEEIDPDFIMLCGDVIQERHDQVARPTNPKPHKRRITKKTIIKIVAVAAVVSILVTTLSFVFADTKGKGFNFNHVSVESYTDKKMTLNYDNIDATPDGYNLPASDLLSQLQGYGINPLMLPEVLLNGEYELYDIKAETKTAEQNAAYNTLYAKFKQGNVMGAINISKSAGYFFLNDPHVGSRQLIDPRGGEEFIVNGIDVILIKFKKSYTIQYFDSTQNTSYSITVNAKYEQAKEIVESIK